jgi:hypothetical protein
MRKLTLDLEDLAVESFQTADGDAAARGTVHGEADSQTACPTIGSPCPVWTAKVSCDIPCTFDSDCGGTCYNSCPETCMSCEPEASCWC